MLTANMSWPAIRCLASAGDIRYVYNKSTMTFQPMQVFIDDEIVFCNDGRDYSVRMHEEGRCTVGYDDQA